MTFYVRITIDNQEHDVEYHSVEEFLKDDGLPILFEAGMISKCAVYVDSRRIAGIPFMQYDRLKESLMVHQPTLERK